MGTILLKRQDVTARFCAIEFKMVYFHTKQEERSDVTKYQRRRIDSTAPQSSAKVSKLYEYSGH